MNRSKELRVKTAAAVGLGVVALDGIHKVAETAHEPTRVEALQKDFQKAKAHPEDTEKGKYIWYATNTNGNPRDIARAVAKDGEYDEVKAEVLANEVVTKHDDGTTYATLPDGNILLLKAHINLDDPLVRKAVSEFGPNASE